MTVFTGKNISEIFYSIIIDRINKEMEKKKIKKQSFQRILPTKEKENNSIIIILFLIVLFFIFIQF